jgi:hypothetical protein
MLKKSSHNPLLIEPVICCHPRSLKKRILYTEKYEKRQEIYKKINIEEYEKTINDIVQLLNLNFNDYKYDEYSIYLTLEKALKLVGVGDDNYNYKKMTTSELEKFIIEIEYRFEFVHPYVFANKNSSVRV